MITPFHMVAATRRGARSGRYRIQRRWSATVNPATAIMPMTASDTTHAGLDALERLSGQEGGRYITCRRSIDARSGNSLRPRPCNR
jgi:hypothetical protein